MPPVPCKERLNAIWAVWLILPDDACNVTFDVPAEAVADAVNASCWFAPGARTNVAGEAVTPVGRPVMVTFICDENPLIGAMETMVVVRLPSITREMFAGDAAIEKSGPGGVEIGFELEDKLLFPHPTRENNKRLVTKRTDREISRGLINNILEDSKAATAGLQANLGL